MAPCCSEANPRLHVSLHWQTPLIRVRLCFNFVPICVFWESELFIPAVHTMISVSGSRPFRATVGCLGFDRYRVG